MKSNWTLCILVGVVCILGTLWITSSPSKQVVDTGYRELVAEMDSMRIVIEDLELKQDSLIRISNNIEKEIIIVKEYYEKEFNGIVDFSVYEHIEFFTEYLSKNGERLYRRINGGTDETDESHIF